MTRFKQRKSVIKRWRVKTGSIDIVGVEADSPMEAATKVFELLHEESKIEPENRLYNIGLIVECLDIDKVKKDPDNNTFYVLSSLVLANAGIHELSKELQELEKLDEA